jgi:hypothetical protein
MWRIVFALLVPLNCFAQPINVTSAGETFEEAKLNGFRTAVEYKLGTIAISEREQRNFAMVRNNIQTYSAGYVESFKILSNVASEKNVTLLMEVNVSESKLRDFLLTEPKSVNKFDNHNHQIQIDTYFYERERGDDLIKSLFHSYPKHAFTVNQGRYQFKTDNNRGVLLVVPYEIRWNYKFITALNETLRHTKDSEYNFFRPSQGRIVVEGKDPKDLVLGNTDVYYFNDMSRIKLVRESLIGDSEPRLLLTISKVSNNHVINICVFPKYLSGRQRSFYGIGSSNDLKIYGNEVEKHEIRVELGRGKAINVSDIDNISLSVVSNKDCHKNRYR